MTRLAIITGGDAERVARYLPSNYYVDHSPRAKRLADVGEVLIEGHDSQGWTLDGYVLPRLASGLLFGFEVDTDGNQIKDGHVLTCPAVVWSDGDCTCKAVTVE